MKRTTAPIVIITAILTSGWLTATPPATKKSVDKRIIVQISDLKTAIAQEASSLLIANGLDPKSLPNKLAADVAKKIDAVTAQLTNNLRMQQKSTTSLAIIQKDLAAALDNLITKARGVVSKKMLTKTVDAFIATLVEEKPVNLEKLPEKMKTEFEQRRKIILSNLADIMRKANRDYVYVSELEQVCHQKLDVFLERAKYVLFSQWGQAPMAALDSLRFVTNTQAYPLPFSKKS